jgi:hypothetical protein
MKWLAFAVLLGAGCTKQVAIGEACADTKQCGNGADCYRGVCTPLCVNDDECDGELVCARHHCLLATGEPRSKPDGRLPIDDGRSPNADSRSPITDDSPLPPEDPSRPGLRNPPTTDAPPDISASLKAIHDQLEEIRKGQESLRQMIEAQKPKR